MKLSRWLCNYKNLQIPRLDRQKGHFLYFLELFLPFPHDFGSIAAVFFLNSASFQIYFPFCFKHNRSHQTNFLLYHHEGKHQGAHSELHIHSSMFPRKQAIAHLCAKIN